MTPTVTENLSLIKEIADKMRDPDAVKRIVLDPNNRNPDPIYPDFEHKWGDLSLAGGYPGVLILLAELDRLFPDEKWDAAAHAYVLKIKESIETHGVYSISLHGGLAGASFALLQASRGESRYQRLMSTLNAHFLERMKTHYLIPFHNNFQDNQPSPMPLFDLIEGVVGAGVYCLQRINDTLFFDIIKEILLILVKFSQPLKVKGKWVPGWYLPQEFQFQEEEKKRFPNGNFNLGLAHGIPGVLGFLAAAHLHGAVVDGQKQAIERITEWIQNHRRESEKGFFWPTTIAFEDEGKSVNNPHFTGRDAWCYGTPGVAASLLLAGKALESGPLKSYALESFRSVFKRTVKEWFLPGPTFCHGISGLLLITHTIAQAMNAEDLKVKTAELTSQLLQYYQPEYPFGFRNYEAMKSGEFAKIDCAGLLEGSAGILLTLLSVQNKTSWWHAPFLVSDGIPV